MSVFDALVGQTLVVDTLTRAVHDAREIQDGHELQTGHAGRAMTHAWLFTGPPGSGRSTAARAFAAALQCPRGGCGECDDCHTSLLGTHPDVRVISTELLSIGVDESRWLVTEAARLPTKGRWRVLAIEDADRLTPQANNALLKVLEEPPARTVWLLCAPSTEDLLPTITSRVRHVSLVTPSTQSVAEHLTRAYGIAPEMAAFAARASQGHIGRAKGLSLDEHSRLRRAEVLRIPREVTDIGAAFAAAQDVVDAATEDAEERGTERDGAERLELSRSMGVENPNRVPRWAAPAFKTLKETQAKRARRTIRDSLDRMLLDLAAYYRDVLVVQVGSSVELVNAEIEPDVRQMASATAPSTTLQRIEAIQEARRMIGAVRDEQGQARSVAPLLAMEALMVSLMPS